MMIIISTTAHRWGYVMRFPMEYDPNMGWVDGYLPVVCLLLFGFVRFHSSKRVLRCTAQLSVPIFFGPCQVFLAGLYPLLCMCMEVVFGSPVHWTDSSVLAFLRLWLPNELWSILVKSCLVQIRVGQASLLAWCGMCFGLHMPSPLKTVQTGLYPPIRVFLTQKYAMRFLVLDVLFRSSRLIGDCNPYLF